MRAFGESFKIRKDHAFHIGSTGDACGIAGNRDICRCRQTRQFKRIRIVLGGYGNIAEFFRSAKRIGIDRGPAVVIDNQIHQNGKNQRYKFRISPAEQGLIHKGREPADHAYKTVADMLVGIGYPF